MVMTEKLTIRDIARLAGVSKATVSRVLNNKPDVDPNTRERVLRIVEEYGFVPDDTAVQLASGLLQRNIHSIATFPPDFFWGASTSAHQIEGALHADGRGPSIWDTFAQIPGTIYRGEKADPAIDHYHRMRDDVALMAQLNINAYRFSLAWSRIFPQGTGTINIKGLDFYDRLIDELLAHNICPVATLYHWDLPQALQDCGGWEARTTAFAFADYAEAVAQRLGDRVSWWITINEPWCSAYLGYGLGIHAPGIQNTSSAVTAAHHLLLAHGLASTRLREHITVTDKHIGITLNLTPVYTLDDDQLIADGAEQMDVLNNRWLLDPIFYGTYPQRLFTDLNASPPPIVPGDMELISTPLDFLGINYYSRSLLRPRQRTTLQHTSPRNYEHVVPVPGASYTEMAWEIYPTGLEDILVRVQRDYNPPLILITENGAAFDDQWDGRSEVIDQRRVHYLQEHIYYLGKALQQGVALGGYFVWSLLDNFEWNEGYSKRFGIVYVDYATQQRIVKQSGRWYTAHIEEQHQRHRPRQRFHTTSKGRNNHKEQQQHYDEGKSN
jgi:beta-glucosidase